MIKHKIFISNVEKEEKWINKWIHQGYRLQHVSTSIGRYVFEEDMEEGIEHEVKIDFRTFDKEEDFQDYLVLFEDSGWRHIGGTKSAGVQYFERMNENAGEEIFSDHWSKAERYKRIANMWLGMGLVFLPVMVVFAQTGLLDVRQLFHLKELYYTPGLWEMTGKSFWMAFLFETPFALGRCVLGLPFMVIMIVYVYFGLKALYWSYKEKKKDGNI